MGVQVFVAGGTGVLGRRLVPQLVARGHEVTATTTSPAKLGLVEKLGATGVVMDGLDAASVGEAVAKAAPDVIVHQMTGLSFAHAGSPTSGVRSASSKARPDCDQRAPTTCWRPPKQLGCRTSLRRATAA
jgi:putative NADH-flavin reductase